MLLQIAFRADDPLGGLLSLPDGLAETLDSFVDVFHRLGAFIKAGETPSKLVDLLQRARGGLLHLLEGFTGLGELRAARRDLREYFGQGAALFAGGIDEL